MKLHGWLMLKFDYHSEALADFLLLRPASRATHHQIILVTISCGVLHEVLNCSLKRKTVAALRPRFHVALKFRSNARRVSFVRRPRAEMSKHFLRGAAAQEPEVHLCPNVFSSCATDRRIEGKRYSDCAPAFALKLSRYRHPVNGEMIYRQGVFRVEHYAMIIGIGSATPIDLAVSA
ncbi:hypothetical protein D3227_18450 [Mesorhizobium waimense]|uniref:Uncharacterized protein n=1 Tax=Mesorhizobium waimense TaxID=1300307 RepID=A0A3A5KNQ4_9HYPH|nr:hypothetical protein D3227_18450 [Mesorhizobium waimense]